MNKITGCGLCYMPIEKCICVEHDSIKHSTGSPDDCKACPQIGATPTIQHSMDCQKLYGNLCSCGADYKPLNNCGEKYCSRIHPIQPDTEECSHWWRELMRNDKAEWYFYCQKCLAMEFRKLDK